MVARHPNKRLHALVICIILTKVSMFASTGDDAFTVAIPADLIRTHRIFSGEGISFTEWKNGTPPLTQETLERIKKRLGELTSTTDEEFTASTLHQSYQIPEDRSSYYQPADDTLERLGIGYNHDDLLLYVLTAPESIHIMTNEGTPVPAWWIGLDSLEVFIHPSVAITPTLLAGGPAPYFQEMLSRTATNWDGLSPSQQKHLLDIANRNNYQAILYRALRHGANSQPLLIDKKFRGLEQDLGLKAHSAGSSEDGLAILGVMQEGDSPLQYSVLTSQFPDGCWIPEAQNTAGIQPLSADPANRRASARYLQTRWDLKIGPKMELDAPGMAKLEPYLRNNCFGFIVDHLSGQPSLASFLAEYQRARARLQEIVRLSAALQEGTADDTTLDQLLENPYLGDAIQEDVFHLLTAAEKFRQQILRRSAP